MKSSDYFPLTYALEDFYLVPMFMLFLKDNSIAMLNFAILLKINEHRIEYQLRYYGNN
jgi:hypothetical protein